MTVKRVSPEEAKTLHRRGRLRLRGRALRARVRGGPSHGRLQRAAHAPGPGGHDAQPGLHGRHGEEPSPRTAKLVVGCKAGGRSARAAAHAGVGGLHERRGPEGGLRGIPARSSPGWRPRACPSARRPRPTAPTRGYAPGRRDAPRGVRRRRAARARSAARWCPRSLAARRAGRGPLRSAAGWDALRAGARRRRGRPCGAARADLADPASAARFVDEAARPAGRPRRRRRPGRRRTPAPPRWRRRRSREWDDMMRTNLATTYGSAAPRCPTCSSGAAAWSPWPPGWRSRAARAPPPTPSRRPRSAPRPASWPWRTATRGVRFNCVMPGIIDTAANRAAMPARRRLVVDAPPRSPASSCSCSRRSPRP